MARCDSPIHLVPAAAGPLILGGGERDEFHRQKRDYAGRWQAAGLALDRGSVAAGTGPLRCHGRFRRSGGTIFRAVDGLMAGA